MNKADSVNIFQNGYVKMIDFRRELFVLEATFFLYIVEVPNEERLMWNYHIMCFKRRHINLIYKYVHQEQTAELATHLLFLPVLMNDVGPKAPLLRYINK